MCIKINPKLQSIRIVILSPHDAQEKCGKGGGDHERVEEPEAAAVVRGVRQRQERNVSHH